MASEFEKELEQLINKHSLENESNTPDFILARFVSDSLDAYTKAANRREQWYDRQPGTGRMQTDA